MPVISWFKEWEIINKKQPDGTTKRFRRRIITTKILTTYTTQYVIQANDEEDNVMEVKTIEDPVM